MKYLVLIFSLAFGLVACNKDDTTPPAPTPDNFVLADPVIHVPKDAYGILYNSIIHFEVEIPGFTDSLGTLVYGRSRATFFTNVSDDAFAEAGCAVNIGGFTLAKQSNNVYVYQQSNHDSLIYKDSVSWNIACKSIGKQVFSTDFPTKGTITSEKEIFRLSGYKVTNTAISGADSIVYQIQTTTTSSTKIIRKAQDGTATQCNFSMDDLLNLDASKYALLSVTGYKLMTDLYSGKKYYSIVQRTTTKLVFVF